MNNIAEIERKTQKRVISVFKNILHYKYLGNFETREFNSNIEEDILRKWLLKHYNDTLTNKAISELIKAADNRNKSLYEVNKIIYTLLRYGVSVKAGIGKNKESVMLIDWENPNNNEFAIAEEVTILGDHTKRPDIVLYINGIALCVLELKRSTVSVSEGIRQNLDNQKSIFIKHFFNTIQLVLAGNDHEGLSYGAIETKEKYFLKWKEINEEYNPDQEFLLKLTKPIRDLSARQDYLLDKKIIEMLNKERLIEILHDYIVYDRGIKKICRPNQYFGVKSAQDFIKRKEGGIIWHTQGSGKSLTMVWLTKWIREHIPNSRVLIITDREELDKQIEKVYTGVDEKIVRTKSGKNLLKLLNETNPWLICSLIFKFKGKDKDEADENDIDNYINDLRNNLPSDFIAKGDIFVFVDECHRTQSGKLHKAMKSLLPDALFIGFTGTPLLKTDKHTTLEVFGKYIHTYKMDEAVNDKVILDLRYEARAIDQNIISAEKIDEWFDLKTRGLTAIAKAELKQKWGTLKKVFSSKTRLEKIVLDIMLDMERKERLQNGRGNALLISDSIYNACRLYELFQNAGLRKCAIITSFMPNINDIKGEESGEGDTEKIRRYNIYQKMLADYFNEKPDDALNKIDQFEEEVKEKFINEPAQMKLLIVVNKLLTGFDAPPATFLYIDRNMKNHGLFQAVCRVNRLDGDDKDYGYIIDYRDLFNYLESAFIDYTSDAFSGFEKEDISGLLKDRLKKGKEKLDELLLSLNILIEPVPQPKSSLEYVHYFCGKSENPNDIKNTEPKRIELYKLTTSLIRAYSVIADDMIEAGYKDIEIEKIKISIKFFEKLRAEIQRASGDFIDLKQFEPAMRHLIDSYVGADDSRVLENFDDMSLIDLLVKEDEVKYEQSSLGLFSDKQAVAEAIENNLRKKIVEKNPQNPAYYDKMSEVLNELIKLRKEATEKYGEYLKNIKELYQNIDNPGIYKIYPSNINSNAKRALYDNLNKNENLAITLNQKILSTKKDNWRNNPQKFKAVKIAITTILNENGISDYSEINRIVELVNNQKDY